MSDVNANIGIEFDTSNALAQLRQLQAGLSKFNQSLTEGNVAAANAQKGLNAQLVQSINATGKFVASQKTITSSTTSFTDALEKNKLSMGQYFRYTAAAATQNSKVFSNAFKQEKDILNRAMKDRVKSLQTQYVQLTNANGDLVKVLQVIPKHLKMVNGQYTDYATRTQMAAQRQQFLNQLIKQGSTQLLNFGKNTQWAGRQLMVGLTIPLTMLGSVAAKAFREMEEATIKFTRVYGDMVTSVADTDKAVKEIQTLAKEFTKFGIAASETVKMAADAAAMGLTGAALQAQVINATKLAVLGQVEQQQALETTISLTNAFGIASEDLANKINFLNAVENQTVLSIEDLTIAVPKAGPVIKQLGGSVEDLAFFMTAMKEGGINASEGANALKSGLASMINPSKKASEFLGGLGINIKGLVEANKGDLKGTVVGFARALDELDPLNRARAIEQLFGKFQFARLSTLFQNVTKDSSQAARALGLAGASVEELAILSERELGKVENAVGVKFQKQLENIKLQLVPIGKAFLEAVTPVVKFAGTILEKFNNLSDGTKKFVVGFIAILGGIAPVALMTVGLVANGVANLIKFFGMLRGGMAKLNGQNNVLGGGFDYLTQAEIDNLAQTEALHVSHSELISTFNVEKTSVDLLAKAYSNAATQARALASGSPGLFNAVPGASGAISGLPKKFASGGFVPGSGNGDTVPALLTPGEFVVTKDNVKKNPEIIAALSNNNVQKFAEGGLVGSQSTTSVKTPGWLQKEYDRIATLSDSNLKRYADLTGMGVDKTMEEIRKAVLDNFEELLGEVKTKTGSLTKAGLEEIGKAPGANGGPSIMGKWFKKFDEGQGASFAHVGQTEKVSADKAMKLNVAPEIAKQMELVKKYYEAKGQKAPDVRVADAFGFTMNQNVNRGMASEDQSKFQKKYGTTVGQAFQDDFAKTGAEKWRTMTELVGENFDKVKGQAEIYNKALLAKVTAWNTENSKKAIPDPFTDDVFRNLEVSVREDVASLIPDFAQVIETAKRSITALRTSIPQGDIKDVNAMLKENNAGSLGPKGSNAKYGNVEARQNSELLGTIDEFPEQVDDAISGGEKKAETQSPSKRTRRLGVNIGEGLRIGLEQKTKDVKSQADRLAEAALPKVDLQNQAKYNELKNDPNQRQIQKSIDRHYRKITGKDNVPVPQNATATKTSVSVAVNPKALAKDTVAVKEAVKNAKRSANKAAKIQSAQEELADATQETASEQKKHNNEVKKTRKKAKKTADAAGDVLIAETDVARSTARTATASETQAQNVVSAAELTQATETALQDSVNNNNQIVKAEEDRAKSAEEIAKYESAIEDQKRKEKERGQAALAAQMAGPVIPDGSQTSNDFINPLTAMSYEDAYEEASTYTRDKNGQLLMDPEFNAPTKLSKKQLSQKTRGMRAEKVSKVSGKLSAGLGTAAMVSGMIGAPPQVTAALGGAATIAQFAPMLAKITGPQGVAAAVVAIGASAWLLNKHLEKSSAEQAKYVESISANTKKMQKIGEITGKVGASELAAKKRENGLFNDYNDANRAGTQFGDTFLQSDIGKSITQSFVDNMRQSGSAQAAKDLALELGAYISDGVMTAEQANSIAKQIGIKLRSETFTARIQGELRMLVGPNGEDILKDPIKARIDLIDAAAKRGKNAISELEKAQQENSTGVLGFFRQKKSGRGEAAQLAGFDANTLEIAQAQADAVARIYDDKIRTLQAELAATTNKEKQLKLEQEIAKVSKEGADNAVLMNQQTADALNRGVNNFKNTAQSTSEGGLGNLFTFGSTGDGIFNNRGRAKLEDAYFDSLKAQVKDKYEGTGLLPVAQDVMSRAAKISDNGEFKKQGFKTKEAAQELEVKINMLMAKGIMTPNQQQTMMDLFDGNLSKMNTVLDIGIKTHGASKIAEMSEMLNIGADKKKVNVQDIILRVTKRAPADFDKFNRALASLSVLDGHEIDMKVFVETVGQAGLDALADDLDKIDKLKSPITKEVLAKFIQDNKDMPGMDQQGMDLLISKWKNWDKLPDLVKKEAISKYETIYQTTFADEPARLKFMEEYAKKKALAASQGGKIRQVYDLVYQTTFNTVNAGGKEGIARQAAAEGAFTYLGEKPSLDTLRRKEGGADDTSQRDTTYDDIMKRLRNVRLAALDAAGGFKELERAIAKTGSKAIKDQFNGLEQQMIKLGKAAQFTDYLAGLDQKELDKMGKAATKDGIDPNTGKKKKGVKAGDFILSSVGEKMEKGINKAILGDYNKAQVQSVTYAQQEIAARTKLLALGFEEADIRTMLADENYKTLIATDKVTKAELQTNAALTKQARLRGQISSAVAGGRDLAQTAANQKRIPEVVKMMQMSNISAEGIRSAISDPTMLDTLIQGMDNFATLGQDAQDEFRTLLDQINDIPSQKIIEIVFTKTAEEKKIAGAEAAAEMFDAYKMIDENTLKNKEGNTFAGLQVKMEDLNNQAKIAQNAINLTQSKIDDLQKEVDKDQRLIETNFTRPIDQKQRAIDKLNRSAEINFTRPIQALQERSSILSHDLEVMNHAAEEINKKYDKQQEALAEVAKVNQQIIQQQQQQLGLADALSRGDIAAAAKAAQDMRGTNASNYANNAQDALQKARENEIKGLKGGVSGLTQEQIQEEQYQIGLKTYDLELKKAAVDKQMLAIQDEIYALEQSRQLALDAIQVKADKIAAITFGTLLDQQTALKTITDQILPLQSQSDLLAVLIGQNDKNRIIAGKTREEWVLTKQAAEAAQKLAAGDLALALAAAEDVSGNVKDSWDSIKDSYDAIKSKKIEILQYIKTIQGPMPEETVTAPVVQTGNGSDAKFDQAAADKAAADKIAADKAKANANSNSPDAKADAVLAAKYAQIAKDTANDDGIARRAAAAAREKAAAATVATAAKLVQDRQAKYGYLSSGGMVPKYFAAGGYARGTDTIPAMLTPGEFVMSRYAVDTHGVNTLKAMNSGSKTSVGDSVYNYNLSVNVKSDANPDEIARTVMTQIRQIDAQRIRGNRF